MPPFFSLVATASVLFFGSARAKDREGWELKVAEAEAEVEAATDDESRKVIGLIWFDGGDHCCHCCALAATCEV